MTEQLDVAERRASAADVQFGFASHERLDVRDGARTYVPHVVAWNLTRRCNLACAHCYIAAGPWQATGDDLRTDECLRIADEILTISPAPMFILSGGEPLLRQDLETLAEHASVRGATVVVGTNGTRLTGDRIGSLQRAGVSGVAVSIDSLEQRYHDRFRHGDGALQDTVRAIDRLAAAGLDFVIQTTVTRGNRDELVALASWAAERGAVSFNVYFLVPAGRGGAMPGLTPEENDAVLALLCDLEQEYRGRMLVRAKCQPQFMRHVYERGMDSGLLNYGTRCPCGTHYCRITPEGRLTPCPYTPVEAGDLRRQSFADVWDNSPVFKALREGTLGGRCGRCEYRVVCGGCRARAYGSTGDLLAEDPACAYEPPAERPLVMPARPVTYGAAPRPETMPWSDDARARISRVPGFVRAVVCERVETFARERGFPAVTPEVLEAVRRELPVDFSRRMPFFMRR